MTRRGTDRLFDLTQDDQGIDELPRKIRVGVALVLLAVALIFVTAVLGISVYAGRIAMQFDKKGVPPIKVNLAVDYMSVSFKSIDGSTNLRGWLFSAPTARDSIVIMVHGMGENRFQFGEDTLDIVESLIANNFCVLTFDLRNSGDSDTGIPTFGLRERDDVLGAIAYVNSLQYSNIVVYGFSSGANAAIMAASKPRADLRANPSVTQAILDTLSGSVDALILDTPITDVSEHLMQILIERDFVLPEFPFKHTIPLAVNLFINGDVSNIDNMRSFYDFIPRHVLLMYGNRDDTAETAGIQEMYEEYHNLAAGKISMWADPNAGFMESFSTSRQEYLEKLSDFLNLAFPAEIATTEENSIE